LKKCRKKRSFFKKLWEHWKKGVFSKNSGNIEKKEFLKRSFEKIEKKEENLRFIKHVKS
jgi:hypothetical protein